MEHDPEYYFSLNGKVYEKTRFSVLKERYWSGQLAGQLAFSGNGNDWEQARSEGSLLLMPLVRPAAPATPSHQVPAAPVVGPPPAPAAPGQRHEYKVLSQKDKWFSGKFDPERLEEALNTHAQQGWKVLAITSASREGFLTGSGKDELIVIFEREKVR